MLKKFGTGTAFLAMAFAAALLAGCKDEEQAGPATTAAASAVDPQFHMAYDDIAVRTATGREVRVDVAAYCNTQIGSNRRSVSAAYRDACRQAIGERMMYAASQENGTGRFEVYLPMGSAEIRPYSMFTVEMMLRAADNHPRMDIFTVTDVRDCATGERVPPVDLQALRGSAGARPVTPVIGRVVDGACRF